MAYYRWLRGARFQGDPTPVALALQQLRAHTIDAVVRAARSAKSPLHVHIFDRAPKEAADEYYRDRARKLARSIVEVPYERAGPEEGHRLTYLVFPGREDDDGDEDEAAPQRILATHHEVTANPLWLRQVHARLLAAISGAQRAYLAVGGSPLLKPLARLKKAVEKVAHQAA